MQLSPAMPHHRPPLHCIRAAKYHRESRSWLARFQFLARALWRPDATVQGGHRSLSPLERQINSRDIKT